MPGQFSPTLRRRELGHRLRDLRHQRDMTLEQVAERLLCSTTKISRIESGARSVSVRDVRDLSGIYELDDAERDRLMALAREAKERAWWQDYDLPYTTYIGLEQSAVALSEYCAGIFPGLLQTPDYTAALVEGMEPKKDPEEVNQRVEARKARQRILNGDRAPQLWAIIDESALHRIVGGAGVMSDQCETAVAAAALSNVNLQVIPFEAGAYQGLNSVFIIMDLGNPQLSDVVYVEGLLGWFFLERAADLRRYRSVFDHMRATALSPRKSIKLIEATGFEYARKT